MRHESDKKLLGKTAVITNGCDGMGLATARLFAKEGAHIVITTNSDKSFDRAQQAYGDHFMIRKVDLTDIEEIEQFAHEVKKRHSKVDILCAYGGSPRFCPLDRTSEKFYDYVFNSNVKGLFFTAKQIAPLMTGGGTIILGSSFLNNKAIAGSSVYAASQAAVLSLAKTLAVELIPKNIRVNALSPGFMDQVVFDRMGVTTEDFAKEVPLGRLPQVEEIARAALFLGSTDSSYILGTELVVDGGCSPVLASQTA